MNRLNSLEDFGMHLRELVLAIGNPAAGQTKPARAIAGRVITPQICESEFNELALVLFELQFRSNFAYREFCESRRISPERLTHWGDIPPIPACAFKELELSCIPEPERTTVFYSSGTTAQQPSRHFHSEKSLEIYEASVLAWFDERFSRRTALPVPGSYSRTSRLAPCKPSLPARAVSLTPGPSQAPHSSLVHMFETLRRQCSFSRFSFTGLIEEDGWVLDCSKTTAWLREAIAAREPVILMGTAFSYVHLLDYLNERQLNLKLPTGSQVLETGGYKGRSRSMPKHELHSLIAHLLGVPASHIVCEYGMSELSSQAYDRFVLPENERPASAIRRFHFPPWARVQIISPETGREVQEGETGLIRVLDLANVYSVMAVQTEDLGVRIGEDFEVIGRATLAEARGCSLMALE